jgi:hypothetical protein
VSISEIASLLEVSESVLYALVQAYPAEVPKHPDDIASWSDFVYRHRARRRRSR